VAAIALLALLMAAALIVGREHRQPPVSGSAGAINLYVAARAV
jgi:hypothetical protein